MDLEKQAWDRKKWCQWAFEQFEKGKTKQQIHKEILEGGYKARTGNLKVSTVGTMISEGRLMQGQRTKAPYVKNQKRQEAQQRKLAEIERQNRIRREGFEFFADKAMADTTIPAGERFKFVKQLEQYSSI